MTKDSVPTSLKTPAIADAVAAITPLAEAGYDLIPLIGRTKAPRDKNWTTRPYERGEALAHAGRGGNVGVRLRDEDLVIDVDPRNFGDHRRGVDPFSRLVLELGLDPGGWPRVQTGGGGSHYYLRKPAGLHVVGSLSGYPGVEFKTRGRQVVAPGSVHPDTGRLYEWDALQDDPAAAPEAPPTLLDAIARAPAEAAAPSDPDVSFEPEEIGRILALTESFEDYEDWLAVLMCVHALSGGAALAEAQEWSWPEARDVVEAKWASFGPRDGGEPRVGWGTLDRLLREHGQDEARQLAWEILRGDPADDFPDDLPEPVAGDAATPLGVLAGWVFVADAMRFVRRSDIKQFRPDQWNSLFASLDPEHNLVTRVYKGKTPVRRYESLVYVPSAPEEPGGSTYIIWRPSGVEAREGDVSVVEEHLAYLFPDESERGYVLDFMHFACVHPEVKVMFAPLIQGEQGTGKTALGVLLKRIIGAANVAEPSPDELKERWTKWQEGASLALIEELMTNGRLELANKLKPVITNETLRIEDKGAPLYSIPNHLNMLCFTNHKNAVRLEAGDRRWLVLFSPAKPRDDAYYARLWAFIEGDAGPAAWKHRLLGHSPRLNPKGQAPMTAAKAEMREASMTDVEATVAEWLASRTGPMRHDLFRFEDAWDHLDRSSRPNKAALGMALRAVGCVKHPRQTNSSLPAIALWSAADHERWAGAGGSERTRAWMEMQGHESVDDFNAAN